MEQDQNLRPTYKQFKKVIERSIPHLFAPPNLVMCVHNMSIFKNVG